MSAEASNRPNILILVIDSLRADHVSCYGYQRQTTPNIDRLAEEGCLFENAITAAPYSPASYASLFSDLYPHQHGVNGDTVRVWPTNLPRLPARLQEQGYATFGVSNNAFVGEATHALHGFDAFYETFRRSWLSRKYSGLMRRLRPVLGETWTRRLEPFHLRWPEMRAAGASMRFLQRQIAAARRPFFGFAILMDPHTPYDARRTEYCGVTPAVREFFRTVNDPRMWGRLMAHGATLPAQQLRIARDLYDAEVRHADQCIGRLVEWLRARRLLDDTLVVVTADHGEAFGERGVWGHGFGLSDCLTRVPLVVRCPRYWRAGTRSDALVQLHDLHPTCLSVAAGSPPDGSGDPLDLRQAADPHWRGREVAFSEFPVQTEALRMLKGMNPKFTPGRWGQAMWAARSREWRCVEYAGGGCELYDLVQDPTEMQSVHEQQPEVVRHFQTLLREHRGGPVSSPSGAAPEDVDAAVLDRLRDLGYIE